MEHQAYLDYLGREVHQDYQENVDLLDLLVQVVYRGGEAQLDRLVNKEREELEDKQEHLGKLAYGAQVDQQDLVDPQANLVKEDLPD